MDVLCTDKTTITEGAIKLEKERTTQGDPRLMRDATAPGRRPGIGLENPLDDAILAAGAPDLTLVRKRAELPFDFSRKRATVVVDAEGATLLVVKGAVRQVLDISTKLPDGSAIDAAARARIEDRCCEWSEHGLRVLGVATRKVEPLQSYTRDEERELTLIGFLTFLDQPSTRGGARQPRQTRGIGQDHHRRQQGGHAACGGARRDRSQSVDRCRAARDERRGAVAGCRGDRSLR